MDTLRSIKTTDYPILAVYWALSGCAKDMTTLYPKDSSYIYERGGRPLYAVAVYEVKGLPIAYVEAVIRDPNEASDFNALAALQNYLEGITKDKGYTQILGFPINEHLANHYEKLGYNRIGKCITMSKELN